MSPLSRSDASLMIALNRITSHLLHEVSLLCARHDLTLTQFAILEALHAKGDLLVGEIQRSILSTPGNVPYVLNNLEKKGYVVKKEVEGDKRCTRISLAPLGRERIRAVLPEHDALLEELFGVLTLAERKALLEGLLAFRKGLGLEGRQEEKKRITKNHGINDGKDEM